MSEEKVRRMLSKRFGKKLSARRLQIGSHKTRLFDIVSENLEIVGEIKEYKYREDYYGTHEDRILGTCYRLHMLSDSRIKRKIMILTDTQMYERFNREYASLISPIELILVEN